MDAPRDQNHVPTALGVSSTDGITTLPFEIDPITGRLLVDATGGGGITEITVTGTVDGSNKVFTCTQPTFVISDGIWFKTNDKQAIPVNNWTWVLGTLTLTGMAPPTSDIYAF